MKNFKLKDVLISLLIISVTLLYFIDNFILKHNGTNFEFHELKSLVFYSKMKILIILISIIWYLTCKHWWKSSILIIITIELLKLVSIFNPNQIEIDKIEFLTSLPITIPIILLLFFISKKISNYNLANELSLKIDNEIDDVFFELHAAKKKEIGILNKKLDKLRKKKNENTIKYLQDLISIREEFYKV